MRLRERNWECGRLDKPCPVTWLIQLHSHKLSNSKLSQLMHSLLLMLPLCSSAEKEKSRTLSSRGFNIGLFLMLPLCSYAEKEKQELFLIEDLILG